MPTKDRSHFAKRLEMFEPFEKLTGPHATWLTPRRPAAMRDSLDVTNALPRLAYQSAGAASGVPKCEVAVWSDCRRASMGT